MATLSITFMVATLMSRFGMTTRIGMKTAAIAGVVALAYIYAMVAMKKPASVR